MAKKAKKSTESLSGYLKKNPPKRLSPSLDKRAIERSAKPSLHQKDLARMSGATAAKAASLKQQERYAKGKPMKLSKIGAAATKAERRTLKSFK